MPDVATQDQFPDATRANERSIEAWRRIIDQTLVQWRRDPRQRSDEGVEPPTIDTIQRAIELAQRLRDAGIEPPDSIVPDPNGGIVFERKEANVSEVYHIWNDAQVEFCRFEGTRLVERRCL